MRKESMILIIDTTSKEMVKMGFSFKTESLFELLESKQKKIKMDQEEQDSTTTPLKHYTNNFYHITFLTIYL